MFSIVDKHIALHRKKGCGYDRPFAYTERATLSLLAGGIWRSSPNSLVLEEFRMEKQRSGEDPYGGRGDIWFYAGENSVYGEAKEKYVDLVKLGGRSNAAKQEIQALIDMLVEEHEAAKTAASAEAKKWPDLYDMFPFNHVVGILFAVPYITRNALGKARPMLANYYEALHLAMCEFGKTYQIVWGRYFHEGLLSEEAGRAGQHPWEYHSTNLDVIICTRPSGSED
jgi:hypothetical protein